MGLNENYKSFQEHVILIKAVPTLDVAHQILLTKEQQRGASKIQSTSSTLVVQQGKPKYYAKDKIKFKEVAPSRESNNEGKE